MRGLMVLGVVLVVGGCAQVLGLEAGHLGDGGAGPDGQTGDGGAGPDGGDPDAAAADGGAPDGGVGCVSWCESTTGCGTCPDTPMVSLDTYTIDATEVTVAEYQVFLANRPGLGVFEGVALCNWIANDLTPALWDEQLLTPDLPVTGVNWCQATGYCFWAKKTLCGRIRLLATGGALDYDKYAQLGTNGSEWYNACTGGNDGQAYPNPDAGTPGTCNVGTSAPRPGTLGTACVGGFAGLFDMSGNVAEWENSCAASIGRDDLCRVRGGSYAATLANARCDTDEAWPRDTQRPEIGFRCCGR